jgi:hypothetical protein
MPQDLQEIAAWAVANWPWLLVPAIVLIGGAAMVYTATVWKFRRIK